MTQDPIPWYSIRRAMRSGRQRIGIGRRVEETSDETAARLMGGTGRG